MTNGSGNESGDDTKFLMKNEPLSIKKSKRKSEPSNTKSKKILKKNPILIIDENLDNFTKTGVTGFPLEVSPPLKIQKQAYWKNHKEINNENLEKSLKDELKNESNTANPSFLRNKLPEKLSIRLNNKPIKKNNKKVKKKKLVNGSFGYGGPIDLSNLPRDLIIDNNEEFCSSCGEPGSFLCCEGCPKSFHFNCLNPPLNEDELPDGDWFCNHCNYKKIKDKTKPIGIFGKLLINLIKSNPHKFELPKQIRESYQGVNTGSFGEFEDNNHHKFLKQIKKGILQELEPIQTFNKDNNEPLFCYKCGLSNINNDFQKKLIKCEYCSLIYHLDCLDPPLTSVKLLGKKWKCPNHLEIEDEENLFKSRIIKNPKVIEVDVTRGFKNDGKNIEINNFNNTYWDDDGIYGKISKENLKNFEKINNYPQIEIIYKVNENGLIKDFLDKIKEKRVKDIEEFNENNLKLFKSLNNNDKENVKNLLSLNNKNEKFERFVDKVLNHESALTNEEVECFKKILKKLNKEKLQELLKEID